LDIVLKVGWLISLRISNRNRILKTYKTDCVSIADIHNSAKVWVPYTKYIISESNVGGVILHLRYENDIPMINK